MLTVKETWTGYHVDVYFSYKIRPGRTIEFYARVPSLLENVRNERNINDFKLADIIVNEVRELVKDGSDHPKFVDLILTYAAEITLSANSVKGIYPDLEGQKLCLYRV